MKGQEAIFEGDVCVYDIDYGDGFISVYLLPS